MTTTVSDGGAWHQKGAWHQICLAAALCLLAAPALAQPPVSVEDAWVRATPPAARMTAGYFTLNNSGRADATLVAVTSPSFERVEMHRSEVVDGVARMEAVESITVPSGGSATLAPGGLHLMLIAPKEHVPEGDRVVLMLVFDDGWEIEVDAPVRRR